MKQERTYPGNTVKSPSVTSHVNKIRYERCLVVALIYAGAIWASMGLDQCEGSISSHQTFWSGLALFLSALALALSCADRWSART